MKLLELFAGTRSVGKVAESMGWEVFSSDIMPEFNTDYTVDILDFDLRRLPWTPDVTWASPPCTTFSVASIGTHWGGGRGAYLPKTEAAQTGLAIVRKTIRIINRLCERRPWGDNCIRWYIENPRGVLRKLSVVRDLPRRETVTYCQYGDGRMKPTDIWTNDFLWTPRPMCKNGDPCHEAAPRGAKTGTQGRRGAIERSRIPEALCREILESAGAQS